MSSNILYKYKDKRAFNNNIYHKLMLIKSLQNISKYVKIYDVCDMHKGDIMEELNIKDVFEFFISKIRMIIFITLIVILIGAIYSMFLKTPVYEANTRLVLTGVAEANKTAVDGGTTLNDVNLNSKLVATYREIIKSKTILKDVINTLNLDYTADTLAENISVSTVSDTEMIIITVKSIKPEETAKVANELARVFSEQIKEIYKIENISIIDKAEVPTMPSNINIVKQVVIYLLIGLVISFGIVFAMFYFDTTLKDASQVERLGLTVLTSIPEKQEDGGKRK